MKNEWQLESLWINRGTKGYGEKKTIYHYGKVKFTNGKGENFETIITEDQVKSYLNPIKDSIVKSATELGEKVAKSLSDES